MTPEFKPHYIAYFDVLGYKAYFEGGGDVERLFDSIMDLTEQVTEARSSDALGPLGITAVSFSDNVAISCDVGASGQSESYLLGTLISLVATIQLFCLSRYGVLIRGGISYGMLFADDRVVFGDALIKAVQIENRTFYPRIEVDQEVVERINQMADVPASELFIATDFDGTSFVNSFALLSEKAKDSWIVETVQNLSGLLVPANISVIASNVFHLAKKYGHFPYNVSSESKIISYERVIRKHLWLLMHFEKFSLNAYGGIPIIKEGADRIVYRWAPFLNSRLCRFELRVFSCRYSLDDQEKMNSDNEVELTRPSYRSSRFRTLRDMR